MAEGLASSERVDDFLDSVSKISQERERESTKRQRSLESNIDDLRQRLGSRSPNKRDSAIKLGEYGKEVMVKRQGHFLLNVGGIARSSSFDEEKPPPMPERKKETPPPFPKRPWERNSQVRDPFPEINDMKNQAFGKSRPPPPKPKRPVDSKSVDSKSLSNHLDNKLQKPDLLGKNIRATDTSFLTDVTKNDFAQEASLEINLINPVSTKPRPSIPPNNEVVKPKTTKEDVSGVLQATTKPTGIRLGDERNNNKEKGFLPGEKSKLPLQVETKPYKPEKPPVLSIQSKERPVTIEDRLANLLVDPTQLRKGRTPKTPNVTASTKENNSEKLPLKKFLLKEEELLDYKVKLLAIHRQQHKTPPPKPSKTTLSSYEEKDALQVKSQISKIFSKEPPRIPKKPAFYDYQKNDSDEIRSQLKTLGKEKSSLPPTSKPLGKPTLSEVPLKSDKKPERPLISPNESNTLPQEEIQAKHLSLPSKPADFGSELSFLLSRKSTVQPLDTSPAKSQKSITVHKNVKTEAEQNVKSSPLTHLNRLRAKGPKRKLPKKMASSQEKNEKDVQPPSEYQNAKKKLPPIVNKRGKQRALNNMKPRDFSGEVFV